jgi:hypothetical protein
MTQIFLITYLAFNFIDIDIDNLCGPWAEKKKQKKPDCYFFF